ncbi:MAG: hypothetical protein ACLURV_06235 [Gallintestinimicrobium sp.]
MGILEGFCEVYPAMEQSVHTILRLFSNAAFVFCRSDRDQRGKGISGNLYLVQLSVDHGHQFDECMGVVDAESIPKLNA